MEKKKRKKPRPYPLKVTDEMFLAITKGIEVGFDVKDACKKEGVGHDAYYTYLKRYPKKAEVHRWR